MYHYIRIYNPPNQYYYIPFIPPMTFTEPTYRIDHKWQSSCSRVAPYKTRVLVSI